MLVAPRTGSFPRYLLECGAIGYRRKKGQMAKASKGKSKSLVLFGNEVKRFRNATNLSQDQEPYSKASA